ncbi:DUF4340 domain-containing protein [Caldicellulosiruptor naganoensis]|uniref:DUF4340 domain-containing protein n=1 Tax=Caldicellulosiruptor naganoensis TaxID=29324 RepID=A0ABY7BEV1_9FIRM|nr:DUF4340 domain-containing protein [Caldicellulosiruptor naganoensis]WAM31343.1 DUF4340 domain-containing protein [Caldicellulosiruptor naganoensis]
MRKRKNRLFTIVSVLLVLVLVIGAYFYVSYVNKKKQEAEEKKSSSASVTVTNFDRNKITKIDIKHDDVHLVLEKVKGKWIVNGINNPSYFDQDKIDDIAFSCAQMTAEKIADSNPKDLKKYGLDNPKSIVEATLSNGKKVTFYLGSETPITSTYYLMKKGDPKIYVVWINHAENFTISPKKLLSVRIPEIDTQNIEYVKLVRKGQPTIEIKKIDEKNKQDNELKYYVRLWNLLQPYSQPVGVSSDKLSELVENVPNFSVEEIVDENPNKPEYGLKDPRAELIVKDNKNTLHLYIGNNMNDSLIYCRLAGSNMVFTMASYKLDFLNTLKPFDLIEKFAYIVNIDYVDKIEVITKDKKHTMILNKKLIKKARSEEEADEYQYNFTVDGRKIPEDTFRKFYQEIIGLLVDGENDKKPTGTPEVTMKFYLVNKKVDVMEYIPYNDDFYMVVRNGKSDFVIAKEQVQKVLKDLEDLVAGKYKPPED